MRSRKSAIEPGMKIIITLLLGILFTAIAYVFLTGVGQETIQSINAKVLAKIGSEPINVPGFGRLELARTKELDVNINITPGLPACEGEELAFSARDSLLPEDVLLDINLKCSWDFDAEADVLCSDKNIKNCGDGKPDNDVEAEGCVEARTSAPTSGKSIKLSAKVEGDVKEAGISDSALAKMSTLISCACKPGGSSPCSADLSAVVGTVVKSGGEITLSLPRNMDVKGAHIKVKPSPANAAIKNLGISAPGRPYAYYYEDIITAGFIVDSNRFPGPTEGSLTAKINSLLSGCSTDPCEIHLNWYFTSSNPADALVVENIHIPYLPKLY